MKKVKEVKKLKVHLKDIYIKSMKELIERYEAALALGISKDKYEDRKELSCLLCHPIGLTFNQKNSYSNAIRTARTFTIGNCCYTCPWMVILNKPCTSDSFCIRGMSIFETRSKVRIQGRIDQLKEWIKTYEDAEDITDKDKLKLAMSVRGGRW